MTRHSPHSLIAHSRHHHAAGTGHGHAATAAHQDSGTFSSLIHQATTLLSSTWHSPIGKMVLLAIIIMPVAASLGGRLFGNIDKTLNSLMVILAVGVLGICVLPGALSSSADGTVAHAAGLKSQAVIASVLGDGQGSSIKQGIASLATGGH